MENFICNLICRNFYAPYKLLNGCYGNARGLLKIADILDVGGMSLVHYQFSGM